MQASMGNSTGMRLPSTSSWRRFQSAGEGQSGSEGRQRRAVLAANRGRGQGGGGGQAGAGGREGGGGLGGNRGRGQSGRDAARPVRLRKVRRFMGRRNYSAGGRRNGFLSQRPACGTQAQRREEQKDGK